MDHNANRHGTSSSGRTHASGTSHRCADDAVRPGRRQHFGARGKGRPCRVDVVDEKYEVSPNEVRIGSKRAGHIRLSLNGIEADLGCRLPNAYDGFWDDRYSH
jgi:hypothetical protein